MIKVVGSYQLEELLYENDATKTYLARDGQSRRVAVTCFLPENFMNSPDWADNADYLDMLSKFKKDADFIRAGHMGSEILRAAEVLEADNTAYIVSEPLPENAKSLNTLIKEKGCLPCEISVLLFLPLIKAVDISCKNGFYHEFINPGTIWVCDGRVVLLSFGFINGSGANNPTAGLAASLFYATTGEFYSEAGEQSVFEKANITPEIRQVLKKSLRGPGFLAPFAFYEALGGAIGKKEDAPIPNNAPAVYKPPDFGAPQSTPEVNSQYAEQRNIPAARPAKKKTNGGLIALFIILGVVVFGGSIFAVVTAILTIGNMSVSSGDYGDGFYDEFWEEVTPAPIYPEEEWFDEGGHEDEWHAEETPYPEDEWDFEETPELEEPPYIEYGDGLGIFAGLDWLEDDPDFYDWYISGELAIEPYEMTMNMDYYYEDVAMNGFACEYDGWVYYRRKTGQRLDFYKERLDGSEITLIKENCAPCFIKVNGGGVFYTDAWDDYKMFYIPHGGSPGKYIGRGVNTTLSGDGESFYYCDLDAMGLPVAADTESILAEASYGSGFNSMPKIDGNYMYYIDTYETGRIGRIDLDLDEETLISESSAAGYDLYDGNLYYIDDDYGAVVRHNLETGEENVLLDVECSQLKAYEGDLYFIDDNDGYNLKKMSLSGDNDDITTVLYENVDYFEIIGGNVYFISNDYESMAFRASLAQPGDYYMMGE